MNWLLQKKSSLFESFYFGAIFSCRFGETNFFLLVKQAGKEFAGVFQSSEMIGFDKGTPKQAGYTFESPTPTPLNSNPTPLNSMGPILSGLASGAGLAFNAASTGLNTALSGASFSLTVISTVVTVIGTLYLLTQTQKKRK